MTKIKLRKRKRKGDKNWILQKTPSWYEKNQYIVDDSHAIERMMEIDNAKK